MTGFVSKLLDQGLFRIFDVGIASIFDNYGT